MDFGERFSTLKVIELAIKQGIIKATDFEAIHKFSEIVDGVRDHALWEASVVCHERAQRAHLQRWSHLSEQRESMADDCRKEVHLAEELKDSIRSRIDGGHDNALGATQEKIRDTTAALAFSRSHRAQAPDGAAGTETTTKGEAKK